MNQLFLSWVSAKADQATKNKISTISKGQTRNRVVRRVKKSYLLAMGQFVLPPNSLA